MASFKMDNPAGIIGTTDKFFDKMDNGILLFMLLTRNQNSVRREGLTTCNVIFDRRTNVEAR